MAVVEVVGVAFAVVLERVVVLVGVPAVEFDDEVGLRKVGVDLSAVDVDVDLWGGEVVFLDEGEEVVLEGGAGGVAGVLDEWPEQRGAGVVGVAVEDVLEGGEAEVAVEASVVDQAVGVVWR